MRLLANENFPNTSIRLLRESGYETESITELMPSAADTKVLKYAAANKQVILTKNCGARGPYLFEV
jgi:predicted nuclease of predicted toxin-antitoxin system